MASGALANQKVTVTSNTFTTYAEEQYTDVEGKVVLHTPVAGSENIITVTTADGSEVTATVAPQNSGEDAGTIAVVPQGMYSLKVTGQIDKTQTARDNGYLFAGDQYSLSVSVENITYIKAKTSEVLLTSNTPELHIIGENSFAISTFMRPDKKTKVFQIQCDSFEAPYIDASIGVSIRDMDGNIWNDSISLRFFRERKYIRIRAWSTERNPNATLNGFVMYPDGYSQFFTVGHNTASAKTLIVPSFPEEETYKMSFCGATSAGHLDSSTEMEYSFAINAEPTVLNGSFRMDEFLAYEENGGNETEDTASQVQNKALVNAYIHEDDIDFYSITVSHDHRYDYTSWSHNSIIHWNPATCEHTELRKNAGEHLYGSWSSYDENGDRYRTCTVCGYGQKDHVHVYESEWSTSETQHWHKASCEHAGEINALGSHVFGSWVTTDPVTGAQSRTCKTCGYVDDTGHVHVYDSEWTYDTVQHWQKATCIHGTLKRNTATHTYGLNDWEIATAPGCVTEGVERQKCNTCGYYRTASIPATGHVYADTWSFDDENHWHGATCGHSSEKTGTAAHTFGSWQTVTDATCGTDGLKKRVCSVCGKAEFGVVPATGLHTEIVGSTTASGITMVCSVCGTVLRTMNGTSLEYLGAYKVLTDSELTTYGITSSSIPAKISGATYVKFGVYPQTIKAASVTVDESVVNPEISGATYYLGSDGNWYAKVTENGYYTGSSSSNSQYRYSNGDYVQKSSGGRTLYFKVEPIIWRVLDSSKGLILAERMLTANVPYYGSSSSRTLNGNTVYANNYKYSNIRAWLNGIDNQFVTDGGSRNSYTVNWTDKGFLQQAFTASQQAKIQTATVDNSDRSTSEAGKNLTQGTDYYCEDTQDKIFLLSEQEVTTTGYGFASFGSYGTGNTRMRKPTDYALANYAVQSSTSGYGVSWWLRSPYDSGPDCVRDVSSDGSVVSCGNVNVMKVGIVPALLVTESN